VRIILNYYVYSIIYIVSIQGTTLATCLFEVKLNIVFIIIDEHFDVSIEVCNLSRRRGWKSWRTFILALALGDGRPFGLSDGALKTS